MKYNFDLTVKRKELLLKYYEQLIQDVLDFGRIYHNQKKKLKALGFKRTGIK